MIINFRYRTDGFVTKTRDTESNPGPTFVTEKAVLGSNLEYGLRFIGTAGIQYACKLLYMYIFIKNVREL